MQAGFTIIITKESGKGGKMKKYFSRSLTDLHHLYEYDEETKKFYWMDHCWTGSGEWILREEPLSGIVEISEERAMVISKGTLKTAPRNEK